jgi:hypothetical protein
LGSVIWPLLVTLTVMFGSRSCGSLQRYKELVLLSHSFFQIRLVLSFDILVIRLSDQGGEDG